MIRLVTCLIVQVCLVAGAAVEQFTSDQTSTPFVPLPVTLALNRPGYVTAVIERADGRRVCNLVSEVKAQAGELTLSWDLYDVGLRKGEHEPYTRTLIEPGTYRVRGLVNDGLDLRYEFSVYSPGQPPWKTDDASGAWMGDHSSPSDCLYLPQGPDGKPGLVLATPSAESGHALSFTDFTGKKFKGINSDNFNGAKALALDRAATAGGPSRVYFVNNVGLCTVSEKDRQEVLLKLTPLKPFGPSGRPICAWTQQGSSPFCPRCGVS